MDGIRHVAAACAALLCMAVASASAQAESPSVPAPVSQAPSASLPAPVAGRMALTLQKVGGSPPFALVGGRLVVRGVVTPYVGGQTVNVSFYRDGRKVACKTVSVRAIGNGQGQFRMGFSSAEAGLVQARADHYATAQQGAFSARAVGVRFVNPNLGLGASGQSVRLLQSELDVLHYAVPLTGSFEEGTGRALIAYRKVTGLERIPFETRAAKRSSSCSSAAWASFPKVRIPEADGQRHVEADCTTNKRC